MSLSLALTLNALADVALVAGLTWFMSRPSKLTPHVSSHTYREISVLAIEQPIDEQVRVAA